MWVGNTITFIILFFVIYNIVRRTIYRDDEEKPKRKRPDLISHKLGDGRHNSPPPPPPIRRIREGEQPTPPRLRQIGLPKVDKDRIERYTKIKDKTHELYKGKYQSLANYDDDEWISVSDGVVNTKTGHKIKDPERTATLVPAILDEKPKIKPTPQKKNNNFKKGIDPDFL